MSKTDRPTADGSDSLCSPSRTTLLRQWQNLAVGLFGPDPNNWQFVCPECGLKQSRGSFLQLGMSEKQADRIVAYSCIRRWKDQGCMHAGGGPVALTISVGEIRQTFEFAI